MPTRHALTVRLPEELHRRVRKRMADEKLSFQQLVVELVSDYIDRPPSNKKGGSEFQRQMAIAREGMRRYRNALRELSK